MLGQAGIHSMNSKTDHRIIHIIEVSDEIQKSHDAAKAGSKI
jgi:hypothetical protein